MPIATVHTARKSRRCGSYPCARSIEPGQRYRRHVAFPGDEGHEEGTRPLVIEECQTCAAERGEPVDGTEINPDALAARDACARCKTTAADGDCCSAHGKPLCHGCYRRTHFVEVCVAGCAACAREGLPLILTRFLSDAWR